MNRITDYSKLATDISNWIKQYATDNNIKSLVVGVSGGIDSAVVSTLCAMTGLTTHLFIIDIYSEKESIEIAKSHADWLGSKFDNITVEMIDLSGTIDSFGYEGGWCECAIAIANTKSRLRMIMLYSAANSCMGGGIVVGTGNKVEDFGVGFFTKYGDGGVDISPIADLYKTEVRELGRYLGISQEIIDVAPTDGLWADGRTDEQQIGATYEELEFVMTEYERMGWARKNFIHELTTSDGYTSRQNEVSVIYNKLYQQNQHKMQPIPIFKLNQ